MDSKKAVAVKYPAGADAPFIAIKGKGLLAKRIVALAEELSIPVVNDQSLADVLSVYEVGESVPPETYEVLAKIFAFVVKCKVGL